MSPDDPHSLEPNSQGRRQPESNLFDRVREWNDVFPWLKLTRTLRLAGSPPLVLLTFVCLGVWWFGESLILGDFARSRGTLFDGDVTIVGVRPLRAITRLAYLTSPSTVFAWPTEVVRWRLLVGTAWSMLVWTPIALLLARQGALLTAGRPMMSLRAGLLLAFYRMPRAWIAALVPSLCVAMIALLIFVLGKLGTWVEGVAALQFVVSVILALIAVACGLLVFGSHFAIPLGWAALANEQNPDPLDSLSRGYEYLLRRPLHMAAYLILSFMMIVVIGSLVSGVASAAIAVVVLVLGLSQGSEPLIGRVTLVLGLFPLAALVTLAWGMVGGVYLLLRCDAGGQEVEDIWMPPRKPQSPLPGLPRTHD